jgi:hypothetical protein
MCERLGEGKAAREVRVRWIEGSSGPWPSQIRHFAGLESFSIFQDEGALNLALTAAHLATLNRNLKKLDLQADSQGIPTLASHLHMSTMVASLAAKLPDGLLALEVDGDEFLGWNHEVVQRLPRSLTKLHSDNTVKPIPDHMESFKASLPPNLTSLKVSTDTFNYEPKEFTAVSAFLETALQLPRTLTVLELGCLEFPMNNMASWVSALPKGLTELYLHLWTLPSSGFSSFGQLSALETLHLSIVKTPKAGYAQTIDLPSLPRSLTDLSLVDLDIFFKKSDLTDNSFKGAPRQLRKISVPVSPLLTKKVKSFFPYLTSFTFEHNPPEWDMAEYFKRLDRLMRSLRYN